MKRDRLTLPIAAIRKESPTLRTFTFHTGLKARPGQFVMLTVFGEGEKPFSIMDSNDQYFRLTIKQQGPLTRHIFEMQVGDLVSIRGPYGRAFSQEAERALLVGGGFATPPLRFLAQELRAKGVNYLVNINGARSQTDLLYIDNFENFCDRSLIATDDGSLGHAGTSVAVMEQVLQDEHFDQIYLSGPERMLQAAVAIARRTSIPFEVNLERYMKCGVGVCGSCVMDPYGFILCMEGPVVNHLTLEKLGDFGVSHRDKTGRIIAL